MARRLPWLERGDGKPVAFLDQLPVVARPKSNRVRALAERGALATLDAPQRRWLVLADRLLWPFVTWRRVKRMGLAIRRQAAAQRDRSLARDFFAAWRTCLRFGISASDYYNLGLYRAERQSDAPDIVTQRHALPLYTALLERSDPAARAMLADKLAFARFCETHSIATPPALALAEGGALTRLEPPDAPGWQGDLIMKPRGGSNGSGFYLWRREGADYVGALGERTTLDALLDDIALRSSRWPIIVQPRLTNGPDWAGLTTGALATIRLVTGRSAAGDVVLIGGALKMPCGGALVDNYMRGNALAQIDPDTGSITEAQFYHNRFVSIERHPDTGAVLAGLRVPQWAEIVSLGKALHAALPDIAVLAMDIASTEDGVMVIEANTRGDLAMIQYPGGRPLGRTPFPGIVLSHLDPNRTNAQIG